MIHPPSHKITTRDCWQWREGGGAVKCPFVRPWAGGTVMSTSRTASCACGQLRVNVIGEPARVGICNCTQCQRRTGGAFAVGAFFSKNQISAIDGTHKAFARSSDAGREVEYHFCPECGSSVFWYREATPELVAISVGCFTDPTFPAPKAAIWAAHKLNWVEFPSGMPVLDAQPG
jgi:hypothetical protein